MIINDKFHIALRNTQNSTRIFLGQKSISKTKFKKLIKTHNAKIDAVHIYIDNERLDLSLSSINQISMIQISKNNYTNGILVFSANENVINYINNNNFYVKRITPVIFRTVSLRPNPFNNQLVYYDASIAFMSNDEYIKFKLICDNTLTFAIKFKEV